MLAGLHLIRSGRVGRRRLLVFGADGRDGVLVLGGVVAGRHRLVESGHGVRCTQPEARAASGGPDLARPQILAASAHGALQVPRARIGFVGAESDDVRWESSYRAERVTEKGLRDTEATTNLLEAAGAEFSRRLRSARLTRQVRIIGWSAIDDTIVKVKILWRVPEVDQAAVLALFGNIEIEWFAKLPNGLIRQVAGWNASASSSRTVDDT